MRIFPVIMAGGSGTRFWPLSRARRPKQFLPLASERPLLEDTFRRAGGVARPRDVYVVCGPVHAPSVRRLLPKLPRENVVVEPVARNTAPAIGLAAVHVAERDPSGIIAVLPSDHHVRDVPRFQALLREAAEVAHAGHLVTLGIRPTRPDTGYGYIQVGAPLFGTSRKVARFVEKPDAETARRYVDGGDYLWNGGIFVFRADVMARALLEHLPDVARGLDAIRAALRTRRYPGVLARAFARMPSISIDYGVMERAKDIAVLPADFGWSDVGSFEALAEVREKDARGNVVSGKGVLAIDCDGCVLVSSERPLAAVGLTDVVVVDAGDAVLVIPKRRSQEVRKAVDALKARRLQRYL